MTERITDTEVYNALYRVFDPATGQNVMQAGLLYNMVIEGSTVDVILAIEPERHKQYETLRNACEKAIRDIPKVKRARVLMTAHRRAASMNPTGKHTPPPRAEASWNREPLPHVKQIIAIASGKGGVGKSTVTTCLAHALTAAGNRVGILDADMYGPSIPRMLGLKNAGQPEAKDNRFQPHRGHGVACLSMGFIADDKAAILRAPMITKALHQMLRQTDWGTETEPLDVLLVDMPPGTGDIHISMVQQAPINGAFIVTTPQEIAIADAAKCAEMFDKVEVPILGVIENMSGFTDDTGKTHHLFGEGGGAALADAFKVSLLAQLPIDIALREAMDVGNAPALPHAFDSLCEMLTIKHAA